MADFIKRFGPTGVVVSLVWICWSDLHDGGGSFAEAKEKPRKISKSSVQIRAQSEELLEVQDPFQASWAPYGAEFDPRVIAKRRLQERRKRQSEQAKKDNRQSQGRDSTIRLEATVDLLGTRQATLSGQTVPVGGVLRGFDSENPPVLVRVKGAEAVVRYGGREHWLHLDRRPSIELGGSASRHRQPIEEVGDPTEEVRQ